MSGELPSVYSESNPVARRIHMCCECRGDIKVGTKYHRFQGLWDRWSSYKTCSVCQEIRSEYDKRLKDRDGSPPFGHLWEYLSEQPEDNPDLVKRYLNNRREMGGTIHEHMLNVEKTLPRDAEERAADYRTLAQLSRQNRFALMFGHSLSNSGGGIEKLCIACGTKFNNHERMCPTCKEPTRYEIVVKEEIKPIVDRHVRENRKETPETPS